MHSQRRRFVHWVEMTSAYVLTFVVRSVGGLRRLVAAIALLAVVASPMADLSTAEPAEPAQVDRADGSAVGDESAGKQSSAPPVGSNPITRVVEGMRNVQQQLVDQKTGQATRKLQHQINRDLDRLIDLARKQQNQSPSHQRPSQSTSRQQDKANQQGTKSGDSDKRGDRRDRNRKDGSESSEDRDGKTNANATVVDPLARLQQGIWGHLPLRLRQRLRNVRSEKTISEYSELIHRYFEALAEQK